MCRTREISNSIVNLGTRTYRQRLRAASPIKVYASSLTRLIKELEEFYDFLYSQWDSITEADYRIFGGQLTLVLSTLKQMIESYQESGSRHLIEKELTRLDELYTDFMELDNDIRQFKIRLPQDPEMTSLVSRASTVLNSLAI